MRCNATHRTRPRNTSTFPRRQTCSLVKEHLADPRDDEPSILPGIAVLSTAKNTLLWHKISVQCYSEKNRYGLYQGFSDGDRAKPPMRYWTGKRGVEDPRRVAVAACMSVWGATRSGTKLLAAQIRCRVTIQLARKTLPDTMPAPARPEGRNRTT